ncbi:signal peptidase I [Kitasatospora acidiphila]|uniref:Signal peptidase I n=1 Tax=Kitasatospora acidiphila TaxID=2567942 RepID=A0A540W044_9ACTN|nr:signal peptidase I [Kitasatospora acidiphila]TQF02395.1 signal peptidase I [Kitasatospora acidiphila]
MAAVQAEGARRRWRRARGADAPRSKRKPRPFWQELPILVVVAVVLALVIKTFFVQAFSIPSESMQNTLQPGDRVLVDKFTPWFGATPERGDVVVFKDPDGWLKGEGEKVDHPNAFQQALSFIGLMPGAGDQDLIKRVIAVGGDTVQCDPGQPVRVNGTALTEPYIYPGATPCDDYSVGTITVPKGKLWMMGDHRNDSSDSRFHHKFGPGDGFVPQSDVVGRAFAVAWPLSRWSTLPVPATFQQHSLAASTAASTAATVPMLLWYRRRTRPLGR